MKDLKINRSLGDVDINNSYYNNGSTGNAHSVMSRLKNLLKLNRMKNKTANAAFNAVKLKYFNKHFKDKLKLQTEFGIAKESVINFNNGLIKGFVKIDEKEKEILTQALENSNGEIIIQLDDKEITKVVVGLYNKKLIYINFENDKIFVIPELKAELSSKNFY